MVLKWFVVAAALLAAFGVVGSAGAQQAAVRQQPIGSPTPVAPDYVIGPEDVLLVSVWKNETLSRQLPVRPDGSKAPAVSTWKSRPLSGFRTMITAPARTPSRTSPRPLRSGRMACDVG